jgi:hypothetical protein
MTRKIWQRKYELGENWIRHNIIDGVFMLYQSIYEFLGIAHVK